MVDVSLQFFDLFGIRFEGICLSFSYSGQSIEIIADATQHITQTKSKDDAYRQRHKRHFIVCQIERHAFLLDLVRKEGLEPPRDCSQGLLRAPRLPISPLPLDSLLQLRDSIHQLGY